MQMNFPLTVATCPFRIPNSSKQPIIDYGKSRRRQTRIFQILTGSNWPPSDVCCDHVEGGQYIGPEFQLGQVYDGTSNSGAKETEGEEQENIVLYRPVYVCVRKPVRVDQDHEPSSSEERLNGVGSNQHHRRRKEHQNRRHESIDSNGNDPHQPLHHNSHQGRKQSQQQEELERQQKQLEYELSNCQPGPSSRM